MPSWSENRQHPPPPFQLNGFFCTAIVECRKKYLVVSVEIATPRSESDSVFILTLLCLQHRYVKRMNRKEAALPQFVVVALLNGNYTSSTITHALIILSIYSFFLSLSLSLNLSNSLSLSFSNTQI